ncbi:hypothetical protein GGI25_000977 [Coemansia spiralis]|uniref:PHD-type domain-containing protein n=2 Tax=Coemansia TaxID=4863 RepID=A0A9W8KYW2_9FUNG|nr:hypothetical protein EDC05_001995 [Coemansia umbellata]KAJ2623210.1 hypothetical protein GGI26_002625 [Coemansia sp. RSA 1358]KAJ2680088.1 hypothetical protein GGI25_000977 [Coemansia spiralis]
MAVDTRGSSEEYEKTVEYIRRLCESEDLDGGSAFSLQDNTFKGARDKPNGSSGTVPKDGKPSILHSEPAVSLVSVSTVPPTPAPGEGEDLPGSSTPTNAKAGGRTNGNDTSAASVAHSLRSSTSNGPQKQANGTAAQGDKSSDEKAAHDTCDACDQPGQFICCDLCPRVFHFFCVDPPMSREAVSKIDHWFCRECAHRVSRKRKSRARAKNIFYPLLSDMEFKNPRVFAVPDEIRRQFDGIGADIDGTFINSREDRPQRVNSGPANRDFTRLTDDHNETILCYRCGLSALHGLVVRCDYCPLNWHWDCLDPPLCSAPPPHKRWMCPNHADHAVRRHRKFRKERVVDLTDAPESTRNNGIVDVIDDDPPWHELFDPKVKYKVPSSRIRKEFCKKASLCLMGLDDSTNTGIQSSNSTEQTARAGFTDAQPVLCSQSKDVAAYSETLQPAMSVAEWLQSIVAFQQDVARFVMNTATQTVPQEADGELTSQSFDYVATMSKDKIGMLSSIALQVLSPLIQQPLSQDSKQDDGTQTVHVECSENQYELLNAIDNDSVEVSKKENIAAKADENAANESAFQTALSALEELPNSISENNNTDNSNADKVNSGSRRGQFLKQHHLSETDVMAAIDSVIDAINDGRSQMLKSEASVHFATPGNHGESNKRKMHGSPCLCGEAISPATSTKRARPLEGDDSDEMDSATNAMPGCSLDQQSHSGNSNAASSHAGYGACSVQPSGADKGRVQHAMALVSTLFRTKGADALFDFLLSGG